MSILPGDIFNDGEVRRPLMARDMDDIAEPFRRDHARAGALMLEHHVRRNRRAVENLVNRIMRQIELVANRHHRMLRSPKYVEFFLDQYAKGTEDIVNGSCLTVKDIMAKLEAFDPDMKVVINIGEGYYGSIARINSSK